jgi:hypothetical protein
VPAEHPEIAVHWFDDGSETPQPTLHDAIQQAVGKHAEVVLRNTKGLELKLDKPLIVSGGRVSIRAAEGVHPVIQVRLGSDAPFLKVYANSSLSLSGLTIDFGLADHQKKLLPVLVESAGSVALDRCSFSVLENRRDARVLVTSGSTLSVTGCAFDGFDEPIVVDAFARCEAKFQQSLFVGYKAGESRGGWAFRLNDRGRAFSDKADALAARRVQVDHCTVVGAGLLAATGFAENSPIKVEVTGTVVKGVALVQWPKENPFPGALKWSGKNNRYDLLDTTWVVCDLQGISGIPKAPNDLESWWGVVGREADTTAVEVHFATSVPGSGIQSVKDFALTGDDSKTAGADPKFIGPGAKTIGGAESAPR